MLNTISQYLRFTPGRLTPRYTQYLFNMQPFITKHLTRFLAYPGSNSQGIRLLNHVINLIDWNWCSRQTDIDIYSNYLQSEKKNLEGLFSRVITGRNYANVFITKHLGKVPEYLIPVEDVMTLSRLPFNSSWIEWSKVRPVKLVYHDSDEYTLDIITDQIRFRESVPTFAVFTIDVIALVLMYLSWLREQKDKEPLPEDELFTSYFLHKYVISGLYYDLVDVWLLNQVKSVISGENVSDRYNDIERMQQYTFIGSRYVEAFEALELRVRQLRDKAITADSLMNSDLMYTNTIRGYARDLIRRYPTDLTRPGYYLTLAKELPLLETIYGIYSSERSNPLYPKLQREGGRKYKRILMTKPWNRCQYTPVAKKLEDMFTSFGNRYF